MVVEKSLLYEFSRMRQAEAVTMSVIYTILTKSEHYPFKRTCPRDDALAARQAFKK